MSHHWSLFDIFAPLKPDYKTCEPIVALINGVPLWFLSNVLPSIGQNIGMVTFFSMRHLCLHSKWIVISA